MKRSQFWLWLILGLVLAYAYVPKPVHFIAFNSDAWFNQSIAIGLGAIFTIVALIWYFTRPNPAFPANFANRWVGMPVLLVGAACSAGFLSAATIVPFAMAMVWGSTNPIIVEVTASYFIPGRKRGFDCQHFVLLADPFGWGPRRICLASDADKRSLEDAQPGAFVKLTGWGDDTAMFYWSAEPVPAP